MNFIFLCYSVGLQWIDTSQFAFNFKVFATNATQECKPQKNKLLKLLNLEFKDRIQPIITAMKKQEIIFISQNKQKISEWLVKCCLYLFSTVQFQQYLINLDKIINIQGFANTQLYVLESHFWHFHNIVNFNKTLRHTMGEFQEDRKNMMVRKKLKCDLLLKSGGW